MKALDIALLKVNDIVESFDEDDGKWYKSEVTKIDCDSEKVYFKTIDDDGWGGLTWDEEWYNINDTELYRHI